MELGYTLMGEEHGPRELVEIAVQAEARGFDFLAASDHFHPWVPEQTHSPAVWSVLGAVAQATDAIGLQTLVTCPYLRYHPAIVAQSAATIACLSGGRFRRAHLRRARSAVATAASGTPAPRSATSR